MTPEDSGRKPRPKRAEPLPVTQNKAHHRAVMRRERIEGPGRGTPFEAYFATAPLPDGQPTLIFEHLQKTAGTAMRQIIHANLIGEAQAGADPEERIEHVVLDVAKRNREPTLLKDWYETWWSSLDQDRRDRLVLATSHSANYLLELIERPTRAFTIIREPVDRVLSRYYFYSRRPAWTLRELYEDPSRWPEARDWFFNYQTRALLEPHYDVEGDDLAMSRGAPPNADLWRERLRSVLEHYVVGVQGHFVDSVRLFAAEFGWQRLMAPQVRINRTRPREQEDEETRKLTLAYNWLDAELYDDHAQRIKELASAAGEGTTRRGPKGEKARREPADRSAAERKRLKRERLRDLSADEAAGATRKGKERPRKDKRLRADEGVKARKRAKRKQRLRDRSAVTADEPQTPDPNRMWHPAEARIAYPDVSLKQNRHHREALMNRSLMKRPAAAEGPDDPRAGTPFEAYFATAPLQDDQPTLIFEHLQKTAGTAMRQIIHANLIEDAAEPEGGPAALGDRVEHMVLDMPKDNRSYPIALTDWYEQWWGSLDQDHRDRLVLATSHSANYLLELIERPTRAFTIIREPVDRVLSRYYFYSRPPGWTLRELYDNPAAGRGRTQFFNYQSRALLEPRYDVEGDDLAMSRGAPANADLWRERLRSVLEQYMVGVQDRFVDSVRLFAAEFGWQRLMAPRVRINRKRPRELEDDETRQLILAYNWLDAELYEQYARRIKDLASTAG